MICFSFLSQSKGQRRERFRDRRKRLGRKNLRKYYFCSRSSRLCDTTSGIHGIGKGLALKKIMKDEEFQEKMRFLIMKMPQRVILLQLERKPLFVYTTACLTKVWIRYDIRYSARRLQQGLRLYIPNVSLRLLQSRSTTASGFITRYRTGEVLRSGHKTGVGN